MTLDALTPVGLLLPPLSLGCVLIVSSLGEISDSLLCFLTTRSTAKRPVRSSLPCSSTTPSPRPNSFPLLSCPQVPFVSFLTIPDLSSLPQPSPTISLLPLATGPLSPSYSFLDPCMHGVCCICHTWSTSTVCRHSVPQPVLYSCMDCPRASCWSRTCR